MKKILFFCLQILYMTTAQAQMYTLHYTIGRAEFMENEKDIDIKVLNAPPIHVDILPGGKFWPPIVADESGKIYVGNQVVDSKSGNIVISHNHNRNEIFNLGYSVSVSPQPDGYFLKKENAECHISKHALDIKDKESPLELLKSRSISIAASDKIVLILMKNSIPSTKGDLTNYVVKGIDLKQCKVLFNTSLGDPDFLIELAWSRTGGWWITGSIERTLLRSMDGNKWSKFALPEGLTSLISSYIVNEKEIWLAAGLEESSDAFPYLVVYSPDAGKTWTSMKKDDDLLKKMPPNWLEGLSRTARPDKAPE